MKCFYSIYSTLSPIVASGFRVDLLHFLNGCSWMWLNCGFVACCCCLQPVYVVFFTHFQVSLPSQSIVWYDSFSVQNVLSWLIKTKRGNVMNLYSLHFCVLYYCILLSPMQSSMMLINLFAFLNFCLLLYLQLLVWWSCRLYSMRAGRVACDFLLYPSLIT